MKQPIDWEAEMLEIRNKATAAARHSERVVGGVSELLLEQGKLKKKLAEGLEHSQEIASHLGLLIEVQNGLKRQVSYRNTAAPEKQKSPILFTLIGLLLGIAVSAAFSWS